MESPHPFAFYSLCYFSSLFSKRLEHPGDALFLLLHVRVNIEIKGCSNVGMTEQYLLSCSHSCFQGSVLQSCGAVRGISVEVCRDAS